MRLARFAAFLLLFVPALAQGIGPGEDLWAFVDQVVAPYRDPKTGTAEKRAMLCEGGSLGAFMRKCLYNPFGDEGILRVGFEPGKPDPLYRGEKFGWQSGDSLSLLASLPSREAAVSFLRSLSQDKTYFLLLNLKLFFLNALAFKHENLNIEVLFPEEQGSVAQEICPFVPQGVAVKFYPKAEAPTLRDGVLVALARSPTGGARASLVAFGGTASRSFAWRGFYGEPFTRGIATSLERMLKRGAQPLCPNGR